MAFGREKRDLLDPQVRDWESMLSLIKEYRIIPFFTNPILGYSIEEHTPAECWISDVTLGPWDWKIDCVQTGEIVYGKFLFGGKASFATVDAYKELMNWRRSLKKYAPTKEQKIVLDYMGNNGSVQVPEVRKLLNIKKGQADALLARLQMQTRVVVGDMTRIYRGSDLHYSGWQRSSFCAPEALFEDDVLPFPGFKPRSMQSSLTPAESYDFLKEIVRSVCGDVSDKLLEKMLG